MYKVLIFLGFFNGFFSPLGMLSYFCGLKVFKANFLLSDQLFLFYIVCILLFNLIIVGDVFLVLSTFRFYFGFYVFYVFFKAGGDFPIKKIFYFLLFLIPLEAILINTIISPYDMPNFPDSSARSHFNIGGYQRPYSFAGNASVSSVILVVFLIMLPVPNFFRLAFFNCLWLFSSGVGYIGFILSILLKRIKLILFFSSFLFFILVIYFVNFVNFVDSLGIKINSKYIIFLFDFKVNQILFLFDGFSFYDIFFGKVVALGASYGGDFGWLYFILGYGVLSFIIVNVFVFSKATRKTFIPIFIVLFSTFHYPVMFFLPGQIVLGYLIAEKYRK